MGDSRCPSCAATIGERTVSARGAGAMIVMGLALTGCPDRTVGDTAGSEGSATAATESSTMSGTGSATASEASSDGEASTFAEVGPAYGVAVATTDWDPSSTSGDQTATDTDGTATDTGTTTDSTGDDAGTGMGPGPQPLYGVVESD
jgi:hypothetical protein